MIIIADCGTSKTDWALIEENKRATSKGYNPNFSNWESFVNSARENLQNWPISASDLKVYFYGTGQSGENRTKTQETLKLLFPNSEIHIESDLLGACRACCGNQPGIVGILGTGSSSCEYDGGNILDQVPSLGYIIGDEGSGVHIGKLLLQAYAYRTMPDRLRLLVEKNFPEGIDQIKKQFFTSVQQFIFLANFGAQFKNEKDDEFIQQIIGESFRQFIQNHLTKYSKIQQAKANFVGSVAFHYSPILERELEKANLKLGSIVQKPVEGLVKYHVNLDK